MGDELDFILKTLAEKDKDAEEKTTVINISNMRKLKKVFESLEVEFLGNGNYKLYHDEFTWSKYHGSIYLEAAEFNLSEKQKDAVIFAIENSDSFSMIVTINDTVRLGFGFKDLSAPTE